MYVHCGDEFSTERVVGGLDDGQVFVTNGPLLRPMVEGQPPGYVFHLERSGPLELEIGLNLATRVPVEYLQIVKNGDVEQEVRLDEFAAQGGKLPPVEFDDSGWFLVRAVTNNMKNYQFASSGPYYVERAGKPRVSRASVQFFLDWIAAAEARIRELPGSRGADAREAASRAGIGARVLRGAAGRGECRLMRANSRMQFARAQLQHARSLIA